MHVFNTSHPNDVSILYKKMNNELDYSKPIESRWIHKNGNCVWIEDYVTPVYDNNENLIAFEGICRDISDRKALEEKLSCLTYHDSLTGLKNRTFYDKQIEELNTLNNLPVGVIVCDLDNLKVINDTMGHDKGDSMIKSASNLLLEMENEHISISRIGGDEFVILIKNTDKMKVEELCRKVNLLIKNYNSRNQEYPIQISIGYAFAENSFGNIEEIFKIADRNMYTNKMHKRNVEYI
jgi:diguanylate cyclase (GGDEF)-like protein